MEGEAHVERQEIGEVFLAAARKFVPETQILISKESKLLTDLKLQSDDCTALALELEQRFGLWIPRDQWSYIYTIGDVIDLIKRHASDPSAIRVRYPVFSWRRWWGY